MPERKHPASTPVAHSPEPSKRVKRDDQPNLHLTASPMAGFSFKFKIRPCEEDFNWFEYAIVKVYVTQPGQADQLSSDIKLKSRGTGASLKAFGFGEGEEDEVDDEDEDDLDVDELMNEEHGSDDEDDGHIGSVIARIVYRGKIRRNFWRDMEAPSQDTAALGFNLFDRYGCLRPEFITGHRKGSGIFGSELNTGNFLQIEMINVGNNYRRRGLAAAMLEVLLERTSKLEYPPLFAFSWPAFLPRSIPDNISGEEQKKLRSQGYKTSVALFRKAGFCSVGDSVWFAYAADPAHASRSLAITEDYDDPEPMPKPTVLQQFERELERGRTKREHGMMTIVVSDMFRGYPDAVVQKLLKLRGITNPSKLVFAQAKYGCTCGKCIAGYLSPRMRVLMKVVCELENDMDMYDDMQGIFDGPSQDDPDDFDFSSPSSWQFLPNNVKPYMKTNKSNRIGHRLLFGHIITCLDKGQAPTVEAVLKAHEENQGWPPHTKNFLQRAGVQGVEAVLKAACLFMADKDLKAGGGIDEIADYERIKAEEDKITAAGGDPKAGQDPMSWIMRNFHYDEGAYEWDLMLKQVECRNDSEFAFLYGMLTGKLLDESGEGYYA